jgi:hypothetical protein
VYHPGANVQTTNQAGGYQNHFNPRTHTTVQTGAGGHITAIERPGLRATGFTPGGHPAHIEHVRSDGSRLVVNRGFRGVRHVEVIHPGGVRVVAYGRQTFVERPFRRGFVSRTYFVGGRVDVRVYRSYRYHSFFYSTYVPRYYYHPAFYGWAIRPWGPRVVWGWGWGVSTPWFYGGYFAPERYYPTPALWLTDYLLAENLRLAYENRQAEDEREGPPPDMVAGDGAALTPEVKMEIAEEVRRQLEAERQAAATPTIVGTDAEVAPPALSQRIFVVSAGLDVTALDGGQGCALSAGDIIERTPGQPITSDGKVAVNVLSSKRGDCPADFATLLDVATLQDMQNQFREQINSGLGTLASNQGKGGLPSGPAADPRLNADGQAPADPQARDLVAGVDRDADQTEAEVQQAANQ